MSKKWRCVTLLVLMFAPACTENTAVAPEMIAPGHDSVLRTSGIANSTGHNAIGSVNRASECPATNRQGAIRGNSAADPSAGAQSSPDSRSAFNVSECGDIPLEGPYGVGCRLGGQSVVMTPPAGSISRVVFVWNNSTGNYVDYAEAFTPQSDGSYRVTTSSATGIAKLQAQIIFTDNSDVKGYADCR